MCLLDLASMFNRVKGTQQVRQQTLLWAKAWILIPYTSQISLSYTEFKNLIFI